jgi:hypothetical protein
MSVVTQFLGAAGEADTLLTADDNALGIANASAQSAAFAAAETAAIFGGVNPFANAAAIVAGGNALTFAVTALIADIKGGEAGRGQIANDIATVFGDAAIIVGGVAGFIPGGQVIAEIADIAGGAAAGIAVVAHADQLSSIIGKNISAAKNSASRQIIAQAANQVNNSIRPVNSVGQVFSGAPSIGSGPSSPLPEAPGQIGDQNNNNAPGNNDTLADRLRARPPFFRSASVYLSDRARP